MRNVIVVLDFRSLQTVTEPWIIVSNRPDFPV